MRAADATDHHVGVEIDRHPGNAAAATRGNREITGQVQGTGSFRTESPALLPRRARISPSSVYRAVSPPPGYFIGSGSTRCAAPVHRSAPENIYFAKKSASFWEG